ncbi:MAG: hypothetical protein JNK99_15710 [Candidatus Accumulibacter sp.]|uniref:hypothetical protein n=1 Tax=Accumulibacter sp. TaxID=2053492 RepID=UPI001A58C952|nr:hypothetical protein [Accumulibacter sp.]MBL8396166.1 hypothetical protein [Accumulibacter sp.]
MIEPAKPIEVAEADEASLRSAENEREMAKLRAALETAMTTLDQIATTPRNAGAKRNASATLIFLRTQIA